MPKRAPAAGNSEVSEAAILRKLQAREQAAKAAAAKPRPSGMDDMAILSRLGIGPGESKTLQGNVGSIKLTAAKGDANRPMFLFSYITSSDDPKLNGVTIGRNFIIEDKKRTKDSEKGAAGTIYQTADESIDELMWELQGIGEDTEGYLTAKEGVMMSAVAAGKRHTAEKTPVRLTIQHWTSSTKAGMNVSVNPAGSDDLADSEATADDDTVEDNATDAATDEAFDFEAWLEGYIDYTCPETGLVTLKVASYDAGQHQFNCVADDGSEWNVADGWGVPADKCEWSTKNPE